MKTNKLTPAVVLAAAVTLASTAGAQVIWVDMDASTPLTIESSVTASPGDRITVAMVLDLGVSFATGVSAYSFTSQFDTVELSLDGAPAATSTPPGGWAGLGAPTETESIGGGLGQAGSFAAFTFVLPGGALYSGSHVLGTIAFDVDTVFDDGLADVTAGLFSTPFDGFNDDSGSTYSAGTFTYMPGYVIPEPAETATLVGLAMLGAVVIWRRQRPRGRE